MSIAIKRLERAVSDLPKGGMQTGSHKVKLDLCDAERLIVELNALQAERDALAAQIEHLKFVCKNMYTQYEWAMQTQMFNKTSAMAREIIDKPAHLCLVDHNAEISKESVLHGIDHCIFKVNKTDASQCDGAKSFQIQVSENLKSYRAKIADLDSELPPAQYINQIKEGAVMAYVSKLITDLNNGLPIDCIDLHGEKYVSQLRAKAGKL